MARGDHLHQGVLRGKRNQFSPAAYARTLKSKHKLPDADFFIEEACTEYMIDFNLKEFKKTHPKLYLSIRRAMLTFATKLLLEND